MLFEWSLVQGITYSIALVVLIIGSITDLKTREVPDFVNYSLIGSGLLLNGLFSAFYGELNYLLSSILGLGIMFLVSCLLFYTGQWGGGDAKMLMGLGALIGIPLDFKNIFLFSFFVNMILAGAVYGICWSVGLAIRNRKQFSKVMRKYLSTSLMTYVRWGFLAFIALSIALFFILDDVTIKLSLLWLSLIIPCLYYASLMVKAVEKSSLYQYVSPSKLTEGDWIAKNVVYRGKVITGPKDLGVEKKTIKKLIKLHQQGKIKNVCVKQGIPFVPSFLLGFIITLLMGNAVTFILSMI